MTAASSTRPPFSVPYLLEWHRETPTSAPVHVIADGIGTPAGWTVARFETNEERLAFMKKHPRARMPCWGRIERGEV